MNRLTFTVSLLLLLNTSFAQNWFSEHSRNEKLNGYIIGITGDTIKGYIQFDYPLVLQKRVLFFKSLQDQNPRVFQPKDIRGYSTADKRWLSTRVVINTYNGPFTFNRFGILESKPGPLVLIRIFDEQDKLKKKINSQEAEILYQKIPWDRSPGSFQYLYIKKNEEAAVAVFHKDFKKSFAAKMLLYVVDYVDLENKIVDREWKIKDIDKIVSDYNQWYNTTYFN